MLVLKREQEKPLQTIFNIVSCCMSTPQIFNEKETAERRMNAPRAGFTMVSVHAVAKPGTWHDRTQVTVSTPVCGSAETTSWTLAWAQDIAEHNARRMAHAGTNRVS